MDIWVGDTLPQAMRKIAAGMISPGAFFTICTGLARQWLFLIALFSVFSALLQVAAAICAGMPNIASQAKGKNNENMDAPQRNMLTARGGA